MKQKYFGVPMDAGAIEKNDGCKKAPKFLFDAFNVTGELFSLEGELEKKQDQVYLQAKEIFKNINFMQDLPIFFGGTHDITGFLVKGFAEHVAEPKLLIFDAHADCEDALSSVTTHEDFVRMLIEKKIIKPQNLMIVGLRKVSDIEKEFLKENKIKHFYFEEVEKSLGLFLKMIEAFCLGGDLYISFDVDVLHNNLMRATGYFPDGGFDRSQIGELLKICFSKAKAFDLVEFNPDKITLDEGKLLEKLFFSLFV